MTIRNFDSQQNKEQLFNNNLGLVYKYYNKFKPTFSDNSVINEEDLLQELQKGLWNAVLTYDKDNASGASFCTYACNCIEKAALSTCKKSKNLKTREATDEGLDAFVCNGYFTTDETSDNLNSAPSYVRTILDALVEEQKLSEREIERDEAFKRIEEIKKLKRITKATEKDINLLIRKAVENLTLQELADEAGVSRNAMFKRVKKAREILSQDEILYNLYTN